MKKLDERVAPSELIVGVNKPLEATTRKTNSYPLSYITYEERGKLNSKRSWEGWSVNSNDPIRVENKFSKGFKIIGNNQRTGTQNRNTDNMLILHPLSQTTFELKIDNFLQLIEKCNIINGEFDSKLIFTKSRTLMSTKMYDAEVAKHTKKEDKLQSRKNNKIKPDAQKVGGMYIDSSSGKNIIYLGTVDVTMKDGTKHHKYCYMNETYRKRNDDYTMRDNLLFEFNNAYSGIRGDMTTHANFPDFIPKTRRALSKNDNYINVYDNITPEDFKLYINEVETIYSRTPNNRIEFNAYWLKLYDDSSHWMENRMDQCTIKTIKCNFREEYKAQI